MKIKSSNSLNDRLCRIKKNMVIVGQSNYSKEDKALLLSIYKKQKENILIKINQ